MNKETHKRILQLYYDRQKNMEPTDILTIGADLYDELCSELDWFYLYSGKELEQINGMKIVVSPVTGTLEISEEKEMSTSDLYLLKGMSKRELEQAINLIERLDVKLFSEKSYRLASSTKDVLILLQDLYQRPDELIPEITI